MKWFLKEVYKFFKHLFYYKEIELISKTILWSKWRDWQENKDPKELKFLAELVDVMNTQKINGDTEEIKQIILDKYDEIKGN